mgnify:CR=1 FL=1
MDGNLYLIKPKMYSLLDTKLMNSSKRLKTFHCNEAYLWHLRLGHISQETIQRLVNDSPLEFSKGGTSSLM